MFVYEKKLQYPVKVATPNPKLAAVIISQYGGPDGELGASLRYLSQQGGRFCPPVFIDINCSFFLSHRYHPFLGARFLAGSPKSCNFLPSSSSFATRSRSLSILFKA